MLPNCVLSVVLSRGKERRMDLDDLGGRQLRERIFNREESGA
jgi:hypothetical protein